MRENAKSRSTCSTFRASALLALATTLALAVSSSAAETGGWVGSWAAALSPRPAAAPGGKPTVFSVSGQTIRQVMRLSIGGSRVRIRLSNEFGDAPLVIGGAHIAIAGASGAISDGSDRQLTFAGAAAVTVPAREFVLSDPVALRLPALTSVAVSLYFPVTTAMVSQQGPAQTQYIGPGDQTTNGSISGAVTRDEWDQVSEIQVEATGPTYAMVALGDSTTSGVGSTTDADRRWPDRLVERMQAQGGPWIGVLNEGIPGNRLLHDYIGDSILTRLSRDGFGHNNVRFLVLLAGVNDLGLPVLYNSLASEVVTRQQIVAGYEQIIKRAHARHIKVYGSTIMPYGGAAYFDSAGEAVRQSVNQWIRTSMAFDAVIDFDKAVRDATDSTKLTAAYDAGDHIHLTDAGYQAMANVVDLKLFH